MPIMRKCNRCGKSYVRSIAEDKYRATKVFPCAIKTIFLCKDCQKEFESLIETFIRKGEES